MWNTVETTKKGDESDCCSRNPEMEIDRPSEVFFGLLKLMKSTSNYPEIHEVNLWQLYRIDSA